MYSVIVFGVLSTCSGCDNGKKARKSWWNKINEAKNESGRRKMRKDSIERMSLSTTVMTSSTHKKGEKKTSRKMKEFSIIFSCEILCRWRRQIWRFGFVLFSLVFRCCLFHLAEIRSTQCILRCVRVHVCWHDEKSFADGDTIILFAQFSSFLPSIIIISFSKFCLHFTSFAMAMSAICDDSGW